MKLAIFLSNLFLFGTSANAALEVPFPKLNQTVVITAANSPCQGKGKQTFTLESVTADQEYSLVCKKSQLGSKTSIKLASNFHYPTSITENSEFNAFPEIKKLGTTAIKKKTHPWGEEYWWSTPTRGSTTHTYLCPKSAQHCFEIIYGAMETLTFDIRQTATK